MAGGAMGGAMGGAGEGRIAGLDLARGVALLAMASFHLTFDLELFGHVPRGTTVSLPFWLYARAIATSFFLLAGVSLWLGHRRGIRWPSFGRRLARIVAAAAVVTAATYAADRDAYVFFGILHSIAAASLVGLLFLRLPTILTLATAAAAFAAPYHLRTGAFDAPWLTWLGLSTAGIRSVDFEPLLPWIAPFLVGIAAARLAAGSGALAALERIRPSGRVPALLAFAGRHSLAVYLLHQPILIGLVWAATRLMATAG